MLSYPRFKQSSFIYFRFLESYLFRCIGFPPHTTPLKILLYNFFIFEKHHLVKVITQAIGTTIKNAKGTKITAKHTNSILVKPFSIIDF